MFDISLAAWSLHRRFRREQQPMRLPSFPAVARHEFAIDKVELVSTFFASRAASYVRELRACADGEGVRILNIAIDGEGDLSAADPRRRAGAVARHARWLPVAAALGCDAVRANTGGQPDDAEALARCTDSFAQLAARGADLGIRLMIENHGGLSTRPENLLHIVNQVGANLGTLPDFGNFPPPSLYVGLAAILPYAVAVHAKTFFHVDLARGTTWHIRDGVRREVDVKRCVELVRASGYRGTLGIEYGGGEEDHRGVMETKALLEAL